MGPQADERGQQGKEGAHGEQKSKYLAYQRNRKRAHRPTQGRIRGLLYLLEKLPGQFDAMLNGLPPQVGPPHIIWERKAIIEKVLGQQQQWHTTREGAKDLIVSMDKGHIRPIVRGKGTKRVGFGAKVNTPQVGGVNLMERLSFDAFNEGPRLRSPIHLARPLTHTRAKALPADNIYATSANRRHCAKNKIQTGLVPKGGPSKDAGQQRQPGQALSKERDTRMEGSLGTGRQHCSLDRVEARTERTGAPYGYALVSIPPMR